MIERETPCPGAKVEPDPPASIAKGWYATSRPARTYKRYAKRGTRQNIFLRFRIFSMVGRNKGAS